MKLLIYFLNIKKTTYYCFENFLIVHLCQEKNPVLYTLTSTFPPEELIFHF